MYLIAAVNGTRQPSLAMKSVSQALALHPQPWQHCIVYKTLSAIVLLHGKAAGVDDITAGALHLLSFFNNTESLVPTVAVGPGHSSRINAALSP